jgi:hypothetical protein
MSASFEVAEVAQTSGLKRVAPEFYANSATGIHSSLKTAAALPQNFSFVAAPKAKKRKYDASCVQRVKRA